VPCFSGRFQSTTDPVYQKSSLLNSDPEFDYSAFLQLRNELEAGKDYTFFAYTFDKQGIYVFADSSNPQKTTVVAVMGESKKCPGGSNFEAMTEQALLMVGVTRSDDILYEPEWAFFLSVIVVLLLLILSSVFVVSYFLQ